MKKCVVLILAVLLLAAGCAQQQAATTPTPTAADLPGPEPAGSPEETGPVSANGQKDGVFVIEDVQTVTAGLVTLGDYMDAIGAAEVSWRTDVDAGEVLVVMSGGGAVAELIAPLENGLPEGLEEGENLALSQESRNLAAKLSAIVWQAPGAGVEPVRGVQPGAREGEVRAAFYDSGHETDIYSAQDVLPGVELPEWDFLGAKKVVDDEGTFLFYNWRTAASSPGEYQTAALYYYLTNGVVEEIALFVFYE